MIIEILYPRLCCLYGDKGNTTLLKACLPDATFLETGLNDTPAFLTQDVDLVCMYSMSEQSQERILERWLPQKEAIADRLKNSRTLFLFTGNAYELLGRSIVREDGSVIEALGVYDFESKRHAPRRFNTLLKGSFEGMTLLGYTSRFSDQFGIAAEDAFCTLSYGKGNDAESATEGLRRDRVIGTNMLGPLLVANPDFAKWLLAAIGAPCDALPYEKALYESYEIRRKEFERPDLTPD